MSSQSVQNLTRGIIRENPTFVMLLGMCPTLGVTTSAGNGLGMGLATLFVLILSNSAISLVKNLIPAMVRIPCYIVIIASFVTVVDLLMAAYLPELHAQTTPWTPTAKRFPPITSRTPTAPKPLPPKTVCFSPFLTLSAWDLGSRSA